MIEGHGDDAYRYKDIRSDFSSNICAHGSHQALMNHLAAHPELISHYPEPEAWTLERMIAERHDIDPRPLYVLMRTRESASFRGSIFPNRITLYLSAVW